jgi:Ca-activated chloride channel family protein
MKLRRLSHLLAAALLAGAAACQTSQPVPMGTGQAVEAAKAKEEVDQDVRYARAPLPPAALSVTGVMAQPLALPQPDRENYPHVATNAIHLAAADPVSTFSIDVDTGSFANVRRFLREGRLPPEDAVRVEELVNYFDYGYDPPRDASTPFAVDTEMAPTPWNARTHLLRVGVQGWKPHGPRVASNLVFLVDVSGSMQEPNKLPLVQASLKLLAESLNRDDHVSLVVYAGASGVVLEPTRGDDTRAIVAALDRLQAGGSTNGGDGIRLAYAMAQRCFDPHGNNRVLLATDGDFNVGTTSFEALVDLVEEKRKSGIALTTLGFGEGNYNDHLMEQLADAGNGNHAYIDTIEEAQKVLVDKRDATLTTIARDVKIQIEFNPAVVSEYRLIGYENRALKTEDFDNDHVDAGEIGAGHTVTALYEVALVGEGGERVRPLRYEPHAMPAGKADELAFLRLRYKKPADGMQAQSRLIEKPILARDSAPRVADTSRGMRLASAVAAFGQLLRGGAYVGNFQYTDVERLARDAQGADPHGYERGFLQMVARAASLSHEQARAMTED